SLGFQHLMTVLHSDSYYLNLPQFDDRLTAPARIRLYTTASSPQMWTGFWITVAILAAHLVLIYTILWMYLRSATSLKRVKVEPVKDYTLLGAGNTVGYATPMMGGESRTTLGR